MVEILDEDTGNGFHTQEETQEPDWSSIFGAPDFTALIKKRKTAVAREYEKRTNSLLKALLVGTLNTGNFPDAAAVLKLGPPLSAATGELAESSETARHMIDLITEPANPWVMFALTGIPLVAQLFRNHEPAIKQAPATLKERRAQRKAQTAEQPPRFTVKIPLIRKTIALRFRFHFKLGKVLAGFRSQTVDPNMLAQQVFTDPDVITALKKMGAVINEQPPET